MEKKTECEIVQDLLLGYVDETLNKESKRLVEKHLIECENCSERLKEIREDIKENQNNQKKEIDYLKKIRRKSKIKSVLIAIGVILLVILILYMNKFMKINSIMSNANKTVKSQNYYSERQEMLGNGEVAIGKLYYKDGKYKNVNEIYSDEETKIQSIIYGEVGTDERIEINEENKTKIIRKGEISKIFNTEENIKCYRFGEQERNSLIANLGKAYIMSIDTDTYDVGKEYYILRNQFEQDQRWEVWIDKETGLVIREIQRDGEKRFITGTDIVKEVRDCTTIYKYELNIVKDEDVKVPEDSTYKIEYINEEINAK
jgi:hypothetical protein